MNAAASSTIKGFYYQFNKNLFELLDADDDGVIIPEGLVEDIDVITDDKYKAIQCKYHESSSKYEESVLYQPILEMILSYYYYSNGKHNNVEYILYIHLSNDDDSISVYEEFIGRMLQSQNKELIAKYICRVLNITDCGVLPLIEKQKRTEADKKQICDYVIAHKNHLTCKVILSDFLDKFALVSGESYSELEMKVKNKMIIEGMDKDEIDKFFYPNAINEIAVTSQQSDPIERKIMKKAFINKIKESKKILITKWTRLLSDYNSLLKHKRQQLICNLQIPTRKRMFIITPPAIPNVEYILANFIGNYLQVYKRKQIQTSVLYR